MNCDPNFEVKTDNQNSSSIEKILIQIIDVSNKIMYNEVKAEKEFLTITNAAVSHELRNPLNSLTG